MKTTTTDCIFCKIAAQDIKTPLLVDQPEVIAFADIHPQAPKHLLVVPRRHVADLTELSGADDAALIGRLVQVATQLAIAQGLLPGGFRLVINTGPDAGQSVAHVHLHVLGGRDLHWPPG